MGQHEGEGSYVIYIEFFFSVFFSSQGTPGNYDFEICERWNVYG